MQIFIAYYVIWCKKFKIQWISSGFALVSVYYLHCTFYTCVSDYFFQSLFQKIKVQEWSPAIELGVGVYDSKTENCVGHYLQAEKQRLSLIKD